MAAEQVSIVVVEMQPAAFAIAPHLARGTLVLLSPTAVAHHLEAVLPHLPKIVAIDIALVHVATHRCASAYGTVASYTGHIDSATALEKTIAHFLLVFTQKTFACVADPDSRIIGTATADKVQ